MHLPLDNKFQTLVDVPYTISFILRKRAQLDNINELPKDKRPSDILLWDGTAEELDAWFDRVFKHKENTIAEISFSDLEIEA